MNARCKPMPALYAVVPAAGSGTRFASGLPKQYTPLDGRPMLVRTVERLQASLGLAATLVAIAPDDEVGERLLAGRDGVEVRRCGGATRGATVRNALATLRDRAHDDDWVLVHDAARPCVPRSALRRLVDALRGDAIGGLLAIPVADTLKRADSIEGRLASTARAIATEDRAALWQAQTPQMFRYGVLARAFADDAALAATDEAQAIERLGHRPRLVLGSPANLKITWPDDLVLAQAILAAEPAEERP